jgi:zinc protease
MQNLVISDATLLPERQVILEERSRVIDNVPASRLSEAMNAMLYQNTHYGIPTIRWAHEMAELNRDDELAWYNRYYTPNNAVLVIAGDVTVDEVKKLTADTFGKVPRRAEPGERHRAQEPPPLVARTVTMADARVAQPSVQREYLVPSYGSGPEKEALALDVLSDILGGGTTSRLYRTLVVDKGIAASAGAWYDGTALDATAFGLYAIPRGDISLEKLAGEVDTVIARIRDEGVSDDELARAKRHVLAEAIYAQDRVSSLARIFGSSLTTGSTIADVQQWPSRIQNVTAADVQDVAKKYLDLRRSVTGYLTSAPGEGRT